MADPRTLPPDAYPVNQDTTAEPFERHADRPNQRGVRESREVVVQTGIDPDAADLDRDYPAGSESLISRQHDATASPSLDRREWSQSPTATADQVEESPADITPLFSEFEVDEFRTSWNKVQAGFVDSPRNSVQRADELVATIMERITTGFAQERTSLEKQWDTGSNVSTEDLRVAFQRYRSFFGRLLSAA